MTVPPVFLLLCLCVGALAQFVDSTLGMAFGITSSTFLLALGTLPLTASASVHTAEIGTTLTAGIAHWRAGNVDRSVFLRIAIPGSLGALLGAHLLARFTLDAARPFVSSLLLVLGVVLLLRFGFGRHVFEPTDRPVRSSALLPLGFVAGFVDAAGGGGWGPIATPTLLTVTGKDPRKVIGTVSASEFLVTLSAVAGFLSGSSYAGVDWRVVLGLLVGGALVAPFAARLARRADPRRFGVFIAGAVLLTNGDQLIRLAGLAGWARVLWLLVVGALIVAVVLRRRPANPAPVLEAFSVGS